MQINDTQSQQFEYFLKMFACTSAYQYQINFKHIDAFFLKNIKNNNSNKQAILNTTQHMTSENNIRPKIQTNQYSLWA